MARKYDASYSQSWNTGKQHAHAASLLHHGYQVFVTVKLTTL